MKDFVRIDENTIVAQHKKQGVFVLNLENQTFKKLDGSKHFDLLVGGFFDKKNKTYILMSYYGVSVYDQIWNYLTESSIEESHTCLHSYMDDSTFLLAENEFITYSEQEGLIKMPYEFRNQSKYGAGLHSILEKHETKQGIYLRIKTIKDFFTEIEVIYNKTRKRVVRGIQLNRELIFNETGYSKPDRVNVK